MRLTNQGVLFDIGSTLITGPNASPAKQICRLLGLNDTHKGEVAEHIMCQELTGPQQLYEELARSFSMPLGIKEHLETLWQTQISSAREIKGATQAICQIKQQGLKVGLVSDIWFPYYQSFLQACPQIAAQVDQVVLSFQEGIKKPSLEMFQRALRRLQLAPEDTWMVGDTYENDLAPAMALGIKTVWVLCRPDKEYSAMAKVLTKQWKKPDVILDSLAQLAAVMLDGQGIIAK